MSLVPPSISYLRYARHVTRSGPSPKGCEVWANVSHWGILLGDVGHGPTKAMVGFSWEMWGMSQSKPWWGSLGKCGAWANESHGGILLGNVSMGQRKPWWDSRTFHVCITFIGWGELFHVDNELYTCFGKENLYHFITLSSHSSLCLDIGV